MKKIAFISVILLLLFLIVLDLGKWMDVTEKPVKADIIICLGGGDHHRFQTAIELYDHRYAKKNILILTGSDVTPLMRRKSIEDGRITYVKEHYAPSEYIYAPELTSTKEEVKYIKRYMKENDFKSALLITDPPHSLRFSLLTSLISVEDDENMTFHMVASGVRWWDKDHYYKNDVARDYVKWEILKIPYNFFAYIVEGL